MEYLDLQAIGSLAKELRLKAKLSQIEVAILIGSSQPNVSAAERGKDTRFISVAVNIIEALSPYQLIGPYYCIKEKTNNA